MLANPNLINRPIVVTPVVVKLCSELVLEILPAALNYFLACGLRLNENDRAIDGRRSGGEDLGLKRRFQILDLRPIGVVVDGHQP